MADIESFIFGPGTPNLDYQALAQRRAIAQALAARKRAAPTTIGEGLTYFGESLADAVDTLALGRKERSQRAAESKLIGGAPEGPAYTGALPGAAPAPAAGAPRADLQIEPQLAPGFFAGGDNEDLVNRRAAGIGGIETGGHANPYQALGPVTKTGDRAYGRYQVMGANIPAWSKAALGAELTPEQFLASKEAQDDIFRNQFGGYADKYGEQGAARAWLGGEGSIDKPGRADQLGTTVGAYGDRYMASLGGAAPAAPTRIAAVNLPGSTISDAAPVAAAPAATPNPPTFVADIKPKPIAGSNPAAEPIPPASEQVREPPGAEPVRPGIIGPTKPMVYWSNVMNNPNVSPGMQAYAKQKYEQESNHLGGIQKRVDEDFTHKRNVWQKDTEDFNKWVREKPDRAIDQLTKRIGIQKSQADYDKAVLDLAKGIHARDGGEWDAALDKAKADAITARRAAVKPDTFSARETQYERIPDPNTGALGPASVVPGAPQPEEKPLTEPQQKATQFVLRTRDDLNTLQSDNGAVLTSMVEGAKSWVPFGSNLLHSDAYRKARNAVDNWGAAFMSHVSGAAITPSEAQRQLPSFIPAPGDDKNELAEKTRRRKQFTDAVEASGGNPTHGAIMKVLNEAGNVAFSKAALLPDVRVSSPDEAAKLQPGQWFITHDGRRKQRM